MKPLHGRNIKGQLQKGFTLVELAIVLVIAGIILTGVLKGTDAINKAKVERMVADLKGLQGTLLEFKKRTGRYAGDCDNNGVVNNNTLPLTATLLPTFTSTTGTQLFSTRSKLIVKCGCSGHGCRYGKTLHVLTRLLPPLRQKPTSIWSGMNCAAPVLWMPTACRENWHGIS
ncbi:MAG: prepilin-type N-terminal cleavage/methylation domain-containing protein [Nitrosomonadales bacterium]